MKFSNELKVGLAILAAVLIFIFGVRYFRDVPLFTGTYEVRTELVDAKGLIAGNPVRINGVKVGSAKSVVFDQASGKVNVVFRVNKSLTLPEGPDCTITGIDALTGIRIELNLGPAGNPPIESGGFVPNVEDGADFVNDLAARAPVLVNRVDSVLVGLDNTIGSVQGLIGTPDSDVATMLGSLRGSSETLNEILRAEQQRISSILTNVEGFSSELTGITTSQADSIARAVTLLNGSLESMKRSMTSLESTSNQLDAMLLKINNGTGSFGKFVNDPGLYNKLDSLASTLDAVMTDFKDNPRRYLREMKIIDLF